ncbi:hypothetical protein THRCLA_22020 [Thraustotheca clavata]|uniref:Uncharacterized protein n=1 Tax=Thraustotheca clavata TaxID=74557 RepID=A0A1V9ZE11_9STRA|nr:hypothetical protein THRCLA_22020 [Thraustotheca clavata]
MALDIIFVDTCTKQLMLDLKLPLGAIEISILNTNQEKCQGNNKLADEYSQCYDFLSEYDITDGSLTVRNTLKLPWYTFPYQISLAILMFYLINGKLTELLTAIIYPQQHVRYIYSNIQN